MDLWNPKYAAHIFKVAVAVDMLGNIVWICPLALGTSADVLIWDGYGPSCTRGDFFDFEVGGHDGAYKGVCMSLCRSLAGRMTLYWHGNNHIIMCMDGTGPQLSNCLLLCGIGV